MINSIKNGFLSEFLRIVNHQLRTPTSIIKGMLSMLVEGSIQGPEKIKETINKVYNSAERLETILDDLLDAQDLIGGKLALDFKPTDLEKLINKVIKDLAISAKQKNLSLIFNKLEKPLPPIMLDEIIMEKVFDKLIDNAVLYTDKGGISINAEIIQQENKEFIRIIVQDTGIGITMADKQSLFKIFSRGKEAEQVHPNGSGLGLYIVNEYIKIHQGKIDIESQGKNKGTSFIIVLPVMIEV